MSHASSSSNDFPPSSGMPPFGLASYGILLSVDLLLLVLSSTSNAASLAAIKEKKKERRSSFKVPSKSEGYGILLLSIYVYLA